MSVPETKTDVVEVSRKQPKIKPVVPTGGGPHIVTLDYPLDIDSRKIIPAETGITFAQAARLPAVERALDGCEAVISVNGDIVPFEQWPYRRLRDDDWLLIVPNAGDDDVVKVVAIVGLSLIAGPIGQGIASGIGLTGTAFAIGSFALTIGFIVGGGILINSLLPPPSPKSAEFQYAEELSASKGWSPQTVQQQGIPVPRVYGRIKSYGNVVMACRRVTGETTNIQDLYALICLGDNPMREPVIPGTMKLNDQAIKNLSDIFYEVRSGELDQKYISYFEKAIPEILVNRKVTSVDGAEVYETSNSDFDDLIIVLSFPFGLHDAVGGNYTVNVTIEVKAENSVVWQELTTTDIEDDTTDKVIREFETAGNIGIERGYRHSVRVTKNTADSDNMSIADDLYIESVIEVTDVAFEYPKRNLVGIKALETDNLSGTIRFSCHSRGSYVRVYNGASWDIEYTNNNAWVAIDILTQPVFTGSRSPWLDGKLLLNFEGSDGDTDTFDDSITGHSITFGGSAELDTAAYKFGSSSLLLDGADSYLKINDDETSFNICENSVEDWTIDIFIKHTDHAGTEVYLSQYEDGDNGWMLYHVHGSGLRFIVNSETVAVVSIAVATEIEDTSWHHLAVIKKGNKWGLYLDGTQIGYDEGAGTDIFAGHLYIGQQGDSSDWFDGNIDHVRIIKSNIFSADPNSTPDDTITVPTAAYTDPGNSFAVSRYDCYDPSQLDLPAWEDLADWCDAAQVNPFNYGISNITQAVKAIVTTISKHERIPGDIVLFRDVQTKAEMEITDGTTATVLAVIDDYNFMMDLDTSGMTAYAADLRLYLKCEGADGSTTFADSSGQGHSITAVSSAAISTDEKYFGNSSAEFPTSNDYLTADDSADWDLFASTGSDATLCGFFNLNASTLWGGPFSQKEDADNYWTVYIDPNDDTLNFQLKIGGVVRVALQSSTTGLCDDTWHHWAVIKKGTDYGLYIDGDQEDYDSSSQTVTLAGNLYIGHSNLANGYVIGYIDEMQIWQSNYFDAAPNATPDDTITVPTAPFTNPTVEEKAPRFAFNGIYDTAGDPWAAALQVLEQCRATPYWKGSKISVAIDKAASPVYMFGPGNCVSGSMRHKYLKMRERAQEIEAHFKDRHYDYERRPISDINSSIGNPANKVRLDYFGVTDEYIVQSLINHRLLKNLHEKRTISKRVEVDAIGVTIGDVVYHQDNLSNWGQIGRLSQDYTGGGRVLRAANGPNAVVTINGNIVFVDADFEGGSTTYELQIKLSDDTIETKTITAHDGSIFNAHKITVSGAFTICPREGDIWAAGKQNLVSKKFRVIDIQLSSLMQSDIILSQYADEVYTDD